MDNTIKKLLAVLFCLALPILFYEQVVFLIARILNARLISLEETAPGSPAFCFLRDNLPYIYSGLGALLIIIILGILYIILKIRTEKAQKSHRKNHIPAASYFYACLFGVTGSIFFNLLIVFSRITELFPVSQSIEAAGTAPNTALMCICTCFLIPLAEELIFRGTGYLHLRKYLNIPSATLLTAVTFAIFHGNVSQSLYAFCMGLLLAHTAEHYRTLISVILFHCSANLTSFFFLEGISTKSPFFSIPILGLSEIACVWLYYKIKSYPQ